MNTIGAVGYRWNDNAKVREALEQAGHKAVSGMGRAAELRLNNAYRAGSVVEEGAPWAS